MADPTHFLGRLLGSIPEPESAYDDLITRMSVAEGGFLWTHEEATTLVDAVLHEAAEKIRTEEAPEQHDDTFDAGAVWASDLIRPAADPSPEDS
ncbi:hypothetical protein [Streptomyces prasinopilosus]|uniref:hypothetical protein n=1 Tax=Streptomyces prasinopilosus TaxID=67344 RepID=UPI0006EBA074|nr:hypothetical protein [Streptomyces prasinopilosus]